jgi:hypothetical protein
MDGIHVLADIAQTQSSDQLYVLRKEHSEWRNRPLGRLQRWLKFAAARRRTDPPAPLV